MQLVCVTNNIIDPLDDGISLVELVRAGGSDLDVVNAARVSYGKIKDKLDEKDEKLINYLLKNKHTSPFEHTQLVYRIKAPIYIVRQWMRHRIGVSYNEISGRYSVLPLEFYVPKKWRVQDPVNKQGSVVATLDKEGEANEIYANAIKVAAESYKQLMELGVCRELARGVLPLTTYTQFVFTCNLVSLFHFAGLRADAHAQWEIQQFAFALVKLARPYFPVSIAAWEDLSASNSTHVNKKGAFFKAP